MKKLVLFVVSLCVIVICASLLLTKNNNNRTTINYESDVIVTDKEFFVIQQFAEDFRNADFEYSQSKAYLTEDYRQFELIEENKREPFLFYLIMCSFNSEHYGSLYMLAQKDLEKETECAREAIRFKAFTFSESSPCSVEVLSSFASLLTKEVREMTVEGKPAIKTIGLGESYAVKVSYDGERPLFEIFQR